MLDAHVHLDFMANGGQVAAKAAAAGVRLLANTVTPAGFLAAHERFARFENVRVGLGLHPWWIEKPNDSDELIALLDKTNLVGEVGLDFGERHAETRAEQIRAFSALARACAEQGEKTLSIHSVRAAREVLDVVEREGVVETCTCIFHWYSGPSDQLKRAIKDGCWFSIGKRMLATKRGREYVKAIPPERMLLETDAPAEAGARYSFSELLADLEYTAAQLPQWAQTHAQVEAALLAKL